MDWNIAHVSETGVPRAVNCTIPRRSSAPGDLSRARGRDRNDELLISRQARALAEAASEIRSLESALARARTENLRSIPPPSPATQVEAANFPSHRAIEPFTEERISVQQIVLLPTVYTNVGSLLDLFA